MDIITKVNNERIMAWKHGRERVYIDPSKITIVEKTHLRVYELDFYSMIAKHKGEEKINKSIVVRPTGNDEFVLVMGIKQLIMAKLLNLPIACIVVDESVDYKRLRYNMGLLDRDFLTPKDVEEIIPMKNVLIPRTFLKSEPPSFEMEMCRDYFIKKGRLDKSITVVPSKKYKGAYILKDEYIRYLILRELGIENVPIKFLKKEDENSGKTKV